MSDPKKIFNSSPLASGDSADGEANSYSMPSYMRAADTHNIANGDKSFLESAVDTVQNIPKFIGASLISGANEIYNIPISVGNMFGAELQRSDTADVISGMDSDLGKYYEENKKGVDLAGFVMSSLVPGTLGIKALHAGQTALSATLTAGKFGENTSKALGLLVPSRKKYLDLAESEAINSNSAVSLINRNIFRSIGAGFGQNILETAAFETAIAATMHSSPILENQDLGDFVSNIAIGGLVFGSLGGIVDATKGLYVVKNAKRVADKEAMPQTFISEPTVSSKTFEKLVLDTDQLHSIPQVSEGLTPERTAFLQNAAESKAIKLSQRIRSNIGEISGGDEDVAEAVYQATKALGYEGKLGNFVGLKSASKISEDTSIEREVARLERSVNSNSKTAIVDAEKLGNISVAYAKIHGPRAGSIIDEVPTSLSLVDTLKKGERVALSKDGSTVMAGSKSYTFALGKDWNILKSDPLEAEARGIWASKLPAFEKSAVIKTDDPYLMGKAYREFDPSFTFKEADGTTFKVTDAPELLKIIESKKLEFANKLHAENSAFLQFQTGLPETVKKLTQDDIASMVNVKPEYLSGNQATNVADDIFARESYAAEYNQKLVQQGSRKATDPTIELHTVPQYVKLTYDTSGFSRLEGFETWNSGIIKEQQKLYMQATDRASAYVIGEEHANLPTLNEKKLQDSANSLGAGAKFTTAASSNYGTLASEVEYIGKVTTRIIEKAQASTREALEPILYKLAQQQGSVTEWSTLSARLRSIPDTYALNEAKDAMIPLAFKKWEAVAKVAQEEGKKIPDRPTLVATDAPLSIPIINKEVKDLIEAHVQLNGKRVDSITTLRTSQGVQTTRDPNGFYPVPVDPKEFKHFALVYDESITGTGHVKSIFANTEDDLAKMVAKLKDEPGLTVRTKKEAEDYYKSVGQFEHEKTLNDNYLDTAMYRKGVSSPYFIPTDPKKVITDLLNWHLQKEAGVVREAISTKYEVPFNELARLGDNYTNIATSTFSSKSLLKYADSVVKNPYADYIKTALGLRSYSDYPWWVNANRMADEKISAMYGKIAGAMDSAKSPEDLAVINSYLRSFGYRGATYDESMELFANTQAPKGVLTHVINKANSLLATVVLRLDFLNAANNAISSNVLLGAETKAVIRAIGSGDSNAVGQLTALAKIKVPGTEESILAPGKLIANSIAKFGTNTPEMAFFKKHGFATTISDQYRSTLDNLTFSGKESIQIYESRIDKTFATLKDLANKGEKWTGNKLAEEFNRFVAADVMKQLTDVAVAGGHMTGQEALSYINTFVNRTQGNYLAAQRPMMFQGPIGQAIGLFQTYQFNLMQQLLRHVGEGSGKDAMTLLALQGTIHGINGLPAFNAINTTIVGNASGNKEHRDTFDAVYGIAGKQAGDWLMYGVASNMLLHPDLKVNLYTRGDINPRHLTIVPTDPASVPIIQATGKFFSNLFETTKKIAAGGDVTTTILQGLEHNGMSRPLAGLAQTLEGLDNPRSASYSTSSKGNVIASNDLLSLANLGRIAGGKPLDEAITQDAMFRFNAYGLRDAKKRNQLGEAIKTTVIAGKEPSQDQIENFAGKYAESGGKQDEFNKWFLQLYKSANLSQANKIRNGLSSQYSQSMQKIMGGYELRDFTE